MLETEARGVVLSNAAEFRRIASKCDSAKSTQAQRQVVRLDSQKQQEAKASQLQERLSFDAAMKRDGWSRGHQFQVAAKQVTSNRLEADLAHNVPSHVAKDKERERIRASRDKRPFQSRVTSKERPKNKNERMLAWSVD